MSAGSGRVHTMASGSRLNRAGIELENWEHYRRFPVQEEGHGGVIHTQGNTYAVYIRS